MDATMKNSLPILKLPLLFISSTLFLGSVAFGGSGGVVIEPYSVGSPGKGNVTPVIWAEGHPSLGQLSFALTLEKGVGGAPAVLVTGVAPTSIPIFGITLAVDPFKPGFFTPWAGILSGSSGAVGAGTAKANLPLPNDSRILGLRLYSQFLVLDSNTSQGLASSRGLQVNINGGALAVLCGHRNLRSYDYINKKAVNDRTGSSPVDIQFNRRGDLLFLTGRGGGNSPVFEIFDAKVSPLKRIKTVTLGNGLANHLVVHPNGKRAYVAVADKAGKKSFVHIIDIDSNSKSFGTIVGKVSGIPIGLHFFEGGSVSANGKWLCIAEFAFGGTPKLYQIDVDPSSPNRDKVRKIHSLLGLGAMATDVAVDERGIYAYVCIASLGRNSSFAQVFLPTGRVMKVVKMGSNALFPVDIDIDPQGKFLISSCSNSKNLIFFPLELGANFMKPRVFQSAGKFQPFSVALTPDSKLAIAASMSNGMVAWNVASGKIVWTVPSNGSGTAMAVR
jgi:DNA-binding beta-propeller fold protein YncE